MACLEEGQQELQPVPWLLCVSWTDVLFPSLLPRLSLEDLFRLRSVSSRFRQLVDEYFAQTQSIQLTSKSASRINALAFKVMTGEATNLRWLDLTGCKCLTNDLVGPVLANNPNLETIDLSDCHHITPVSLQKMAVSCKKIKRLVLRNCHWVTRFSMEGLASHQSRHLLTTLNLTGCWELVDSTLNKILGHFQGIRYLSVCNIYSLTDQTMRAIASGCPDLVALDIRGCWRITDAGLNGVAEYCHGLKVLHVVDCKDIGEPVLHRLRQRGVQIDRPVDPLFIRGLRAAGGGGQQQPQRPLRLQV